jgi:pimeloyl-ACP methyl ester carboxylesterase
VLLAAIAALLVATSARAPALTLKPCNVQGIGARCGTFPVPENRSRPRGQTIGLHVVVVPSLRKPARPDAFTYLAGGPGVAATELTSSVAGALSSVHETRDILLVDQRGTGRSNQLSCPPPPAGNSPSVIRAYVRSCLDAADGDMTQYGTRAAMDDLDAVRAALGYRQLDVYGVSYGATAAQVYLKRHPSSVRTLILDGATALDVPFYGHFAANAERALAQVAKRCAADTACARAFPGWRAKLTGLVRAWDLHPVQLTKSTTLDGAGLAGVIQTMLLDAYSAASIPLLVTRTAAGDYRKLQAVAGSRGGPITQLMYWSIWCNEPWVGLGAKGPWGTVFDGYTHVSIASHRAVCSFLPKRAEPPAAWTEPHSSVPALVLAGGADPQDPIGNLPNLKHDFPDSRALVVPGQGHAIGFVGCLGDVVGQLVGAGTVKGLDTSCVAAILAPSFSLS